MKNFQKLLLFIFFLFFSSSSYSHQEETDLSLQNKAFLAIETGNMKEVRFHSKKIDINFQNEKGITLLMKAVNEGNIKATKYFLKNMQILKLKTLKEIPLFH